jgi:hypothetical protein
MEAIHAMPCFVAYFAWDGSERKSEHKKMLIRNPHGYVSLDNH